METATKKCRICGNIYPLTKEYFRACKRMSSGFHNKCNICHNEHIREYNKLPHVQKRNKEYKKKYKNKYPERIKAQTIIYNKKYYASISERRSARWRKLFDEDPEFRERERKRGHDKYLKARSLETYKEKCANRRKRAVESCYDGYIKGLIVGTTNLSRNDIPKELVELKRKQLKLKRDVAKKQCRKSQT